MNDTYGHIEGDTLLHEVGKVLRSSFRESDVLGRVGGDEFLLLLKNIDLEVALDKLEQVKRQLAAEKPCRSAWACMCRKTMTWRTATCS